MAACKIFGRVDPNPGRIRAGSWRLGEASEWRKTAGRVETMARIKQVLRGTQDVRPHPTEVDCFYQVVTAPDGTRLVHLSTFGSAERQSEPKSSQSLQLDEAAARELVNVLLESFPAIGW